MEKNNKIKESILEILNNSPTSPFLFIGTGLSIRYLKTESWEDLLRLLSSKTKDDELAFEFFFNQAKRKLKSSKKNILFPEIASLIENEFNHKWFTDNRFKTTRKKYANLIKSGISPFKIEIANHFKNKTIVDTTVELKREINLLKKVGEKNISGMITTNYDTLLEQIFPEYKVYAGQHELIFSPIQGIGEIYKIHGCCTKPNTIVINSEDYKLFNEKNAYLSAKLLTIFLEHPIIFIGYSLNDENINKILKSIIKCLSQEQLSQLKKRLIFVEWNKDKKSNDEISIYSKNFEEDNKTLDMTRLFINDFSILYNALLENNTKSRYSITILRKLKEDIYDLVLTNDPKGQLKVLSPINKIEDKNKIDYVVGIGISKQFAIKGLIGVNSEDVYKDILFDTLCSNPEFNINIFIEKTLPELLKNNGNSIPIYKYIKIFNNDNKLPKRIKDQIKHNYTDLLNRYLKKNQLDTTIKILRKNYNDLYCSKLIARIKEENMNVNDLYEYLKSIFNNYPDILSPTNNNNNQKSDIRRLIKIYDWLKYYKK